MDSIPELEGGEIDLVAHVNTPYGHCRGLRQGVERDTLVQDDDDRQGILEEYGEATRRGFHESLGVVLQSGRERREERGAQKTAEFIEERIGIINDELGTTESELAAFKQRSGLTNLTSDAQMALQESSRGMSSNVRRTPRRSAWFSISAIISTILRTWTR